MATPNLNMWVETVVKDAQAQYGNKDTTAIGGVHYLELGGRRLAMYKGKLHAFDTVNCAWEEVHNVEGSTLTVKFLDTSARPTRSISTAVVDIEAMYELAKEVKEAGTLRTVASTYKKAQAMSGMDMFLLTIYHARQSPRTSTGTYVAVLLVKATGATIEVECREENAFDLTVDSGLPQRLCDNMSTRLKINGKPLHDDFVPLRECQAYNKDGKRAGNTADKRENKKARPPTLEDRALSFADDVCAAMPDADPTIQGMLSLYREDPVKATDPTSLWTLLFRIAEHDSLDEWPKVTVKAKNTQFKFKIVTYTDDGGCYDAIYNLWPLNAGGAESGKIFSEIDSLMTLMHTERVCPGETNFLDKSYAELTINKAGDREDKKGIVLLHLAHAIATNGVDLEMTINKEKKKVTLRSVDDLRKEIAFMSVDVIQKVTKRVNEEFERLIDSATMDMDPPNVSVPTDVPTVMAREQASEDKTKPMATATATAIVANSQTTPLVVESHAAAPTKIPDDLNRFDLDDGMDVDADGGSSIGSSTDQLKKVGDALQSLMGLEKTLPLSVDTKGLQVKHIKQTLKQLTGERVTKTEEIKLKKRGLFKKLYDKLEIALGLQIENHGQLASGLDMTAEAMKVSKFLKL